MNISATNQPLKNCTTIIPVLSGIRPNFADPEQEMLFDSITSANLFSGRRGDLFAAPHLNDSKLVFEIFVGMGNAEKLTPRSVFESMFGAFFKVKSIRADQVQVLYTDPNLGNHRYLEKAAEAVVLSRYTCPQIKSQAVEEAEPQVVFVTNVTGGDDAVREGMICGSATNLARRLVNEPAAKLYPRTFAEEAMAAGKEAGFECIVLGREQTAELGMNAFLAVGRGSEKEPVLTVMRYTGNPQSTDRVALVGKGITFDSGGYNMKSNCTGMNEDMGGAAAVLGAIKAAAQMGLKINVSGVVAACENMVSDRSYLPSEIIRSMNGKTIEVENTDCEGRLTLCDAMTYAIRKEHATTVIDIATLTGSVLTAVGNETAGMISSSDQLSQLLCAASDDSCEKIWRLPIDHDLMYAYDSPVADIKNQPGKVGAGCSMAGMFLEDFAEGLPWAHLDVACAEWNRHIANAPKVGSSAFGTRLLYSVLKLLSQQPFPSDGEC